MRISSIISLFGTLFGALSVLMLVKYSIDMGDFSSTFKIILHYYDNVISIAIGWMQPLSVEILKRIENYLSINLTLLPQWKHVFVAIWLYFIASTKMIWSRTHNITLTIFAISWGAVCALLSSVMSGAVSLNSDDSIILMISLSILGVLTFEVGVTLSRALNDAISTRTGLSRVKKGLINYIFPALLIGVFSIWFSLNIISKYFTGTVVNIGLIGIGIYILNLSFYWCIRACINSSINRRVDESFYQRFRRSGGTHLSLSVVNIVIAVFVFILMNAGLSFAGL